MESTLGSMESAMKESGKTEKCMDSDNFFGKKVPSITKDSIKTILNMAKESFNGDSVEDIEVIGHTASDTAMENLFPSIQ